MKIKLTQGCICDSLTIDGKEEIDLNDDERVKVLNKVLDCIKPSELNVLLQLILPIYGEYYSDGIPCSQCGDIVETYSLEIQSFFYYYYGL